jgi:hypothetical protein
MHFASLAAFPPVAQVLKLQPPHVVKGRFQSADRSHEIRIVKVAFNGLSAVAPKTETVAPPVQPKHRKKASAAAKADNIVEFRAKNPP